MWWQIVAWLLREMTSQDSLCLFLVAQFGEKSGPAGRNSPARQGDIISAGDRRISPTAIVAESRGWGNFWAAC
jgi:hypothetical protein